MITKYINHIKENIDFDNTINIMFSIDTYYFNKSSTKRNIIIYINRNIYKDFYYDKAYLILKKYGFAKTQIDKFNGFLLETNRNSLLFIIYQMQKEFDKLNMEFFKRSKYNYNGFDCKDILFTKSLSINQLEKIFSNINLKIDIYDFKKLIEQDLKENPDLINDQIIQMFLTTTLKNKYSHFFNAKNFDLI